MVDGWNAYFCEELGDLVSAEVCVCVRVCVCPPLRAASHAAPCPALQQRLLPEPQPNSESVGELWLGLLRFYTEEFDFKEHVISIRQKKRLTTFEKQWTSKCIAIEGARAAAPPPGSPPLSSDVSAPPLRPLRPEPQPGGRSLP